MKTVFEFRCGRKKWCLLNRKVANAYLQYLKENKFHFVLTVWLNKVAGYSFNVSKFPGINWNDEKVWIV